MPDPERDFRMNLARAAGTDAGQLELTVQEQGQGSALLPVVLEVSGLNDSASPVSARALCARPARPARGRLALTA